MQTDPQFAQDLPAYQQVDVADPLEVARWSWLLDVTEEQIRHAVAVVGVDGQAVAHYIEYFWRSADTVH